MTRRWRRTRVAGLALLPILAFAARAEAVSVVRGPYLQQASPTTLRIVWYTDVASDSRVLYGLAGIGEQVASGASGVTRHDVQLAGLTPATVYAYSAASTDGAAPVQSPTYRFRTAPAAPTDAVRFVAFGDTQIPALTGGIAPLIAQEDADLLIHVGDQQNSDGTSEASWTSDFFTLMQPLIANVPVYPIPGNHEYAGLVGSGNVDRYLEYFSLPSSSAGDERFYSFDYGCVHFVGLDLFQNHAGAPPYALTTAQRDWLVADLAAAAAMPWKVVYLHYPIFTAASSAAPWQAQYQADLVPIFEAAGVDYVVQGHFHVFDRSVQNGVTYLTQGGANNTGGLAANPFTVDPLAFRFASSENGYILFDATPSQIALSVKNGSGDVIDRDRKSSLARNVILFVGDGMGSGHVDAGRLFVGGSLTAPGPLSFEDPALFPHQGRVVTTLSGGGATDSAAAGTALATGFLAPAVGSISQDAGGVKTTILELARDNGLRTGLVTTRPLDDATPAAFAAHDLSRGNYGALRWDLFRDDTVSTRHAATLPDLLLGGGQHGATWQLGTDAAWLAAAQAAPASYSIAYDRAQLLAAGLLSAPRVLGLLDNVGTTGDLLFAKDKLDGLDPANSEPTLSEATVRALEYLTRAPGGRGFFLVVESGLVEKVSEGSVPGGLSGRDAYLGPEVETLHLAVGQTMDWLRNNGLDGSTLVVVTADHETGGVTVPWPQATPKGPRSTPEMSWSGAAATTAEVPVFATWPSSLAGQTVRNTEIFGLMRDYLYGGVGPDAVGVAVSDVTDTGARVTWSTYLPGDSRVDYGTTQAYGSVAEDATHARVTSHEIVLTGLTASTSYHLSAVSSDLAGYPSRSADLAFTTHGPPPGAPSSVTVTDQGAQLSLAWTASPGATEYSVARASASGGPYAPLTGGVTLVPFGASWRWNADGTALPGAWRTNASFDDAAWPQGPAPLGYSLETAAALDPLATVVPCGVPAGCTPSQSGTTGKYPTTYFRGRFDCPHPEWLQDLSLGLVVDDGTVTYLNGTEVHRSNMPSGSPAYATFASSNRTDPTENDVLGPFALSLAALVADENVVQVEVHQSNATSADMFMDLELVGTYGPRVTTPGFDDGSAPAGANVYYVVTATNSEGTSAASTEVCASRGAPALATGLQASGQEAGVDLAWTASTSCDVSGYRLHRSTTGLGGAYTPIPGPLVSGVSFSDSGCLPGEACCYQVSAVDSAGYESAPTAGVCATACSLPCGAGTYESQACSANADRTCTACSPTCGAGTIEVQACGGSVDRICAPFGPDAGTALDAAEPADAATQPDVGVEPDAGAQADAAEQPDAAAPPDAGEGPDAHTPADLDASRPGADAAPAGTVRLEVGCGCGATSAGSQASLSLALLGLLAARRRRSSGPGPADAD